MWHGRIVAICALALWTQASLAQVTQTTPTATAPSEAVAQEVAALIKSLEAEEFAERQRASEKLVEMGKAIHPVLNKALAEDEELGAQQKSRLRDVLIDDGAIIRLEKSGKLDQDQTQVLEQLRINPLKRNDSYRAAEELRRGLEEEEMIDEGLALLVYSLVRQIAKDDNSDTGFQSHQLYSIFDAILAQSAAGESTGRAFGHWIREYVIPRAFPADSPDGPRMNDYQVTQTVQKLLVQDSLDAATYDALVSGMCRQMSRAGQRSWGGEFGLNNQTVIPVCYSRHCRSEHIGRIIEAIMSENFHQTGWGGWSAGSQCLNYVVTCPKLTEDHARALVQWLVCGGGQFNGFFEPNFESLVQLTGEPFVGPEDMESLIQGYVGRSNNEHMKRIEDRIRQWYAAHQDKPIISDSPPRYRYLEVEISGDEKPQVRVLTDTPLKRGMGQFVRDKSDRGAFTVVCESRCPQGLESRLYQNNALPPDAVNVQVCRVATNGSSIGSQMFVPGDPQFVFQSTTTRDNQPVQSFRAAVLLPVEGKPADEQLASVDFWIKGCVRAATEQTRRAAQKGRAGFGNISGPEGTRMNPLGLESYRVPGLEAEVRKLITSDEPWLVASAALLLARWQADFDPVPARQLLASGDASLAVVAAEALALAGDPEGIRLLAEQMKDPMRTGSAAKLLDRAARSAKIDPAAKKSQAAKLIESLLPAQEVPGQACLAAVIVVKAWTGEDFGYEVGADPAKNSAALKRYHEWAAAANEGK